FTSPLDIPLYLSGTFGELRTNHFHSGIDIKTNGREGQPVKAAASGVVYRIKVSPYGFGNALYVRHPNGYSTVYAHLQRFNEEIAAYVRKEQYRQKSYGVELYPPSEMFPVEQGEVIALSGNSGGSGGPHLHFEVRDTRTENIINPLFFGFDIKDTRHPDLYELLMYRFADKDLIGYDNFRLIEVSDGEYRIAGNDVIEYSGSPAFALQAYDRLDGAANKNGVYQIKMWIGAEEYYDFTMESFAFDETRYINSHIDFGQKICCNKVFNRLYLEPNNRLSVYGEKKKMNLPELERDSIYPVRVEVKDAAGNMASLSFNIKRTGPLEGDAQMVGLPVFKYGQTNYFKTDDIELVLPEGALYRDVYFEYEEKQACEGGVGPVYALGAREIPVHRYFNLKLKPPRSFKGNPRKLAVASVVGGRIADYEGSSWENGYVVGRTRQLGDFTLVADSVPPRISSLDFSSGKNVSSQSFLKLKVTDNFSGIDTYSAEIDGEWVLMEYDAKYRLMTIPTADLKLSSGEHKLVVSVKDEMGNKSEARYSLIF
ncbi:MAG TPA: M23 family peptidase, partial [Cryomorphaceae bacterium]|nr:M23 family peptidase [Cryomorphaceae bacterium]